jgi:dTDP-N-acetylfucosamine:lipid II N-acetylfucosaminyltransferase
MSAVARNRSGCRVLHVGDVNKFIVPLVDFLEEHCASFDMQEFFVFGDRERCPLRGRPNVYISKDIQGLRDYKRLVTAMNGADKIILHGLFNVRLIQLLAVQAWLLKKCYWVMWGADLYVHRLDPREFIGGLNEVARRFVIKRLGHLCTYIEGDAELARTRYGARGAYAECFMYPSNLYHALPVPPKVHDSITVQIGNSADPSNEHLEVLDKLKPFRDRNVRLFVPLSYGDPAYAQRVIQAGQRAFGDQFVPMVDFMPFEQYLGFLGEVDIAIFNHRRQQAMGNILTLLGLGKKVYMRDDITPWNLFRKIGARVFPVDSVDLTPMSAQEKAKNVAVIKSTFTARELAAQYQSILSC